MNAVAALKQVKQMAGIVEPSKHDLSWKRIWRHTVKTNNMSITPVFPFPILTRSGQHKYYSTMLRYVTHYLAN